MRRADIGLISLLMRVGDKDVAQIKIYRDGTLIRIGAGAMPPIPIGAVSYWPGNGIFEKLMEKLPPQMIVNDIDFVESDIQKRVVYEMKLGGSLTNGLIGENANWAQTRLIRFELDVNTSLRSPVLVLLDMFIKDAMGHSNAWYFDALILAIFNRRSNHLPKKTLIAKPEHENLEPELANFLSQLLHNPRRWNFMPFPQGKTYYDEEGKPFRLIFKIDEGKFSYHWMQ